LTDDRAPRPPRIRDAALDRFVFAATKPSAFIWHSAGTVLNRKPVIANSILARDSRVTRRRFSFALLLPGCLMLAGTTDVLAMPAPMEVRQTPLSVSAMSGLTRLAQTQPAQAPATPPSPAQPGSSPSPAPAAADEPIGNVATLTGTATVIRNKDSIPLKLQDDIFLNDVLQTSANSTLGVTFNDATTFNLTANARITVDSFVYEEGDKQNKALFDITKGTVAFVATAVAKTGDMKISTPSATLGIRGTTGLVEVPEGAATGNANNVAIKLYPDPDGKVGRIEVNDRAGARLGFLTQGASGFTIRPGAGGRFAALPLVISPQQALRDQRFVRQVHAAQSVGRQIVTQRRIQRLQNPAGVNPGANPPRPPGLQKQNGLPQRPGSPQQPGLPKRPGQQQQPQQQPPQPPGLQRQPNAPGVLRPGLQNKPLLQRRPAELAPKGKLPKERRY
jgi:FecR protein